jgi:hypothetical protein
VLRRFGLRLGQGVVVPDRSGPAHRP